MSIDFANAYEAVVVPLADPSIFENALMSMICYLIFPGLPAPGAVIISLLVPLLHLP
jgi:hypothetical protein